MRRDFSVACGRRQKVDREPDVELAETCGSCLYKFPHRLGRFFDAVELNPQGCARCLRVEIEQAAVQGKHGVIVDLLPELLVLCRGVRPRAILNHDEYVLVGRGGMDYEVEALWIADSCHSHTIAACGGVYAMRADGTESDGTV